MNEPVAQGAVTRRELTKGLLAASLASPVAALPAWPDEPDVLISRSENPLNLETPVERLGDWLTPNELFFVRNHLKPPDLREKPFSIQVDGLVERPEELSLAELSGLEQVVVPAVLQCSGNGRAFFDPLPPGIRWERGAVGQAEWSGVRLRDVLARSGVKQETAHLHVLGGDLPAKADEPQYVRSLPIERALDPNTLLATHINGKELPPLHGWPARLVVPGWTGNHWVKWVRGLRCATDEATGFYQQSSYRVPQSPLPPGADPRPADLVPVTWLNVKSLITRPARQGRLQPGRVQVRGVAWTGRGHIARVEVSVDGGNWAEAKLVSEARPFAWRLWEREITLEPGIHTVRARATDSDGQTQPERTAWNKSGYLWNGIDAVPFECREA